MSENPSSLAAEGARELHLDLGAKTQSPNTQNPNAKVPGAPSCRSPGDRACSSHPPLTWSEHGLIPSPARLPRRPFCTGRGEHVHSYPLLTWGKGMEPGVLQGGLASRGPRDTCAHHQVLSWALAATGRFESQPWDPCLRLTGETLVSAVGLRGWRMGLRNPGWAARPAPTPPAPPLICYCPGWLPWRLRQ